MMPELKLNETNQELRKELQAALLKIKSYEALISDMQTENSNLVKKTTHDLASPLQILAMTIESLEDKAPKEMIPTLERMKRSTDLMISIITNLRKIGSVNNNHKLTQDI
jgi:signal transduction histidine kinase